MVKFEESFKFGLTKDFLVSFCGGGRFGGINFLKIPISTGGVLPDVGDLDGFVKTFGGCGTFTDCAGMVWFVWFMVLPSL